MAKISFGPFTLDPGRRRLTRNGRPVTLSPKAFNLLSCLVARRPNVVDKGTLMNEIWPDTAVVEANLNVLVSEIRAALSDRKHKYVETAHGVGFAFAGEVVETADEPIRRQAGSRFWLAWNDRTFILEETEHVIGRDPHSQVWLDESGVSRQHAKIHIDRASGRAEIEDLGSTNGTFVGDRRITNKTPIGDGDAITVGPRALVFRTWIEDRPRPTERIKRN